jgi:hypothetical protein
MHESLLDGLVVKLGGLRIGELGQLNIGFVRAKDLHEVENPPMLYHFCL